MAEERAMSFGQLPVFKATRAQIGKAMELMCPSCGGDLAEIVKGKVAGCHAEKILFAIGRQETA